MTKLILKNRCYHCGDEIRTEQYQINQNGENLFFCCNGCYNAYLLIHHYQLDSYYKNRDDFGSKPEEHFELSLYEIIDKKISTIKMNDLSYKEKSFYLEGLHCASCVWLNEKVLSQIEGVIEVRVNFSNNRVYLKWNPELVSLKQIAEKVYKIGYKLKIIDEKLEHPFKSKSDSLLKKMAIAGFFTGNNMLISVSLYAGYFDFMESNIKQFFHFFSFLFATPVFFYSASEFFRNTYYSLKNKILSMDVLTSVGISLAFFYSTFITFTFQVNKEVYFDAICFVVFAILTGRFIESRLKLKTFYFTTNLGSLIPAFVKRLKYKELYKDISNIKEDDYEYVEIEQIQPGDIILINSKELVPLDGILLNELIEVDEASITGEYTPITKKKNELIVSGSKNLTNQLLLLKVSKNKEESTISQILKLSESCLHQKSSSETLANKVANIFILFVLILAFLTFFYWFEIKNQLNLAIIHTLSLLIVACPCALSLSIPTAIVVGIQKLFSKGIFLKQSHSIEILAKAKYIAFDKTGTLTKGKLEIESIYSFISNELLISLIQRFNQIQRDILLQHPISNVFFKMEYQFPYDKMISLGLKKEYEHLFSLPKNIKGSYIPGQGVLLKIDENKELFLGSKEFFKDHFINYNYNKGNIIIYLGLKENEKKELLALFLLRDTIRENAIDIIQKLNQNYHTILLTGDNKENAEWIQQKLNIKEIHYSLKPEEKAKRIQQFQEKGITIMIGDGINDVIALNQSDVGISFADASRLAMYNSNVMLLNPDLEYILFLLNYSKNIIKKIKQNLLISFFYNTLLLPLAFMGFINPFIGSIFMSLSSITVVLNSLTLTKYE